MIANKLENFILEPSEKNTFALKEIFKLRVADCRDALETFKNLKNVPAIPSIDGREVQEYKNFWDYLFHSPSHLNAFYNDIGFSNIPYLPKQLGKTNFKKLFESHYSYFDYSAPQNELIYIANEEKFLHYRENYENGDILTSSLFLYSKKLCGTSEVGEILKFTEICRREIESITQEKFVELLEKMDIMVKSGNLSEKEIAFLYLCTMTEFRKMFHKLDLANSTGENSNPSLVHLYKNLGLGIDFNFFWDMTRPEPHSYFYSYFKKPTFELDIITNAALMEGINKMYMSDTIMQEKDKLGEAIDEVKIDKKISITNKI